MDEMQRLMQEAERAVSKPREPVKQPSAPTNPPVGQRVMPKANKRLRSCPTCGNQVDKGAVSCPKCGRKIRSSSAVLKLLLGIFIIGIFGVIFSVASNNGTVDLPVDRERVAYRVSTNFVTNHLKAPCPPH